jgi:membrane carboxypeptidase/penicillin-binding protein
MWFFYYSGDLPDIKAMGRYAPSQVSRVSDPCFGNDVVAIPYDAIGYNLRAALNASEGDDRPDYATRSVQIARSMFCAPSKALNRELKEVRVAAHLKRRFSHNELLTIYANRVWLGENCNGVQAAAEHYFGKESNQLDIAEAALLAGLIQGPSRLSPYKHPDRALQRRNEVIEAMARDHAISLEQAAAAKATSLAVILNNH